MVAYKSGVVCGKETAQMCDKVEHQVRIPTHTHRVCSKKELAVIHATTLACIPLQDSSYDVYTLQRTTGYTIITYQCKLREETTARGHNTLHTLMAWEGGGVYKITSTHAHTHMHTHTCTHTHALTCTHTCIQTCTHTCTQTCTHTCATHSTYPTPGPYNITKHVHKHTRSTSAHKYMHTGTHTYTCTWYTNSLSTVCTHKHTHVSMQATYTHVHARTRVYTYVVYHLMTLLAVDGIDLVAVVNSMMAELGLHVGEDHTGLNEGKRFTAVPCCMCVCAYV